MMVSTKGRYALRVLLALLEEEQKKDDEISLKVIAEDTELSEKYLESIIRALVSAGIVKGTRGKGGGYRLTKNASDIKIKDILASTEATLAPVACLVDGEDCPKKTKCKTLPLWQKMDSLVSNYLESITLQDLVNGTI